MWLPLTHEDIRQIGTMMSDIFKQIATLDAGILLLIVTIVEKVYDRKHALDTWFKKALLSLSLLCFLISVAVSLLALISIPQNTAAMLKETGDINKWVDDAYFYAAIWSFITAIALFFGFAVVGFFSRSLNPPPARSLLEDDGGD